MLFWKTKSAIQGHSGLCECSSEGNGIKSLRANRDTLEQVRCFLRIAGDGGHAATQLSQELTASAVIIIIIIIIIIIFFLALRYFVPSGT